MIIINKHIKIDESEITIDFVRSSGPGGQNVNKVATAAQLRFNVDNSPSLTEELKTRIYKIAKNRINSEGELLIDARSTRSQEKNRQDAVKRLVQIIREASHTPKKRKPTKPTRASHKKRLESKKRHGEKKKQRRSPW